MKIRKLHLVVLLLVISIVINIYTLKNEINIINTKDGTINDYDDFLTGYIPDGGYVPDSKTAVKIAEAVFKNIEINHGVYNVTYDKNNRIWIVQRSSFFGDSGLIFIHQDDGKIIQTLKNK